MPDTVTPPVKNNTRKRNAKKIRNAIIAIIVVAALAVGGVFLYRFLNQKTEVNSTVQSDFVRYGTIQSKVNGSGNARAKESAAITLSTGGVVQEVLVMPGDIVYEGQPLYSIFSPEAEQKVEAAQTRLDTLYRELAELQSQVSDLVVRAPFAGKLIEVQHFAAEQQLHSGTEIATLVNDKTLKLSLYFSYAYENDIYVGQSVDVTIPAVMGSFTGTVEKINKVSYISPEGAVHFEVIASFPNPGTLTAGMNASAILHAADGTELYPYEGGKTEYAEVRAVVTKAGGPVLTQDALIKYANVTQGQPLLQLGSSTLDDNIAAKLEEIESARSALEEAQQGLTNTNAAAPINGTVTSCTLVEGMEVKAGDTVLTISNTTNMEVEITVDDRNIAFVQPGMMVELSDWNGAVYFGTVASINMGGAQSGNGMTSYPVTLSVDNYDGSLLAGMWLSYSFVASESESCMMVPMQSVKYVSDNNGDTYCVVFIRADQRPENAVDLDIPDPAPGETPRYPSEKDGFYPVTVTTGLSDNYNVEIREGLNGDEEVFVNFYVESAWG